MCAVKFQFLSALFFMVFSIHTSISQSIGSLEFQQPFDNLEYNGRPNEAIDPLNIVNHFPNDLHYNNVPDDLCAPYDPPLPDFRTPGRRISETKCFEYHWLLITEAEKALRQRTCRLGPIPEWSNKISRRQAPLYVDTRFDVNVDAAKRGEFPNMGAIGWKALNGTWRFMCGSSLISSKFVLTAAHCSEASKADLTFLADTKPKIVRLGRTMLDHNSKHNTPFDAKIINVIVHPNFKSPIQYYDIALMELAQEVLFSEEIRPACLWNKNNMDTVVDKVKITGWDEEPGSSEKSAKLLVADVDIIDSTTCNDLLASSCNRNWCGLDNHQMCAGKLTGGVDTCRGDSGGPLQVKIPLLFTYPDMVRSMNYVIGVTAFGIRCGLPGLPGVYTRVDSFIDWIESIVWPDFK
ncbi:serine protease snake [Helicoverpa armigera]|uniref:serine protease snake n=1 Tax=Helicoverpa armigera TaxID=29058 RepID=UPI003082787A